MTRLKPPNDVKLQCSLAYDFSTDLRLAEEEAYQNKVINDKNYNPEGPVMTALSIKYLGDSPH